VYRGGHAYVGGGDSNPMMVRREVSAYSSDSKTKDGRSNLFAGNRFGMTRCLITRQGSIQALTRRKQTLVGWGGGGTILR